MNVIKQFDTETLIDERYKIDTLLGSGRSGSVYCARDMHLERLVGLKFLNLNAAADDDASVAIRRFELEAKALHLLDHPNIVKVFRYGVFKGQTPYLALEFIEGQSLRQELDTKGKINGSDLLAIAKCVCSAMDYAHQQNIIHRDLKPENIILLRKAKQTETDKENSPEVYAKVVDFGLCKLTDDQVDSTNLTRHGFLTGTPAYMSPEQCMGKLSDKRADIYAFGCVLFEMLKGKPPFEADSAPELMYKQINEAAPIFDMSTKTSSKLAPTEKSQLKFLRIIQRCLQKNPDARYQSFAELSSELGEIKGEDLEAHHAHSREKHNASSLKKAATIFCCVTVVAVAASMYLGATVFKDELNFRAACLTQEFLAPEASIDTLSKELQKLLKSGQAEQAKRLVQASTQNSRFSTWDSKSQLALLENYFNIYRNSGEEKQAIDFSIEILTRALRELPVVDPAKTPSPPPQELVQLINRHCAYIKKAPMDRSTLKRISKELEEIVSIFHKRAPSYLFEPALLRAELAERLIRPNSWNDKMRVLRYYEYLLDVVAGAPELAPHTVSISQHVFKLGDGRTYEFFQDNAQLLKEVLMTRIALFRYYCKQQDRVNADLQMKKIEEQVQFILLSHRIEDQIEQAKADYSAAFLQSK